MIGNPSKLSVFSPNNREIHVGYVKQSIKLQRKNSSYSVKTSHKLFQGYGISINCFRPINIKFTGWSKNCVHLNISNSDLGNSLIDINGKGYTMRYNLTGNNYIGEPQLEQTNTRKYINKRYPTESDKEKENKLIIDNKNLEFHLDLSEFVNLEELICSKNQLTSLDISKNKQLTEIDCSQNKLVSLDLKTGIEFLPDSIMNFRCLADKRSEAKVKKTYEQLEAYTLSPIDAFQGRYNLKAWKKNWKLIKQKEALQQVEKELELDAKFTELEEKESSLRTGEEDLEKEELINRLKQQNEKKIVALNNEIKNKEELINNLKQQNEEKSISLNNEIKGKEKLNDKLNEETKKWQDSLKEINALNNQLENKNVSINKLQKQTDELTRLLNEETEKYKNMILIKKGELSWIIFWKKQRNVIQTNENSASEELEKIRRKLIDDYEITEEEIRDILHKQAEKAKLDTQLKSLIN
ncbi:hypothetical protein GLOIN_2v1471288 [Rhizophagus irregularis DAOM 181602=DAOM 197198]|uniref:Uncharacterized protein n=1 Tax=Rhizophagus irregularis (strain DAOM 181602 / DAOM 197198 / MUCL 43194) TaxID=747089 RepID=A0A2P4QT25_RHIID|nr:hypothetical protein GLOIN_2v1471288 [Rhizophagus irregularis DAOM 181602=DAOM 197198]POG80804.1 hypothetical protein GLOIN_2v1471288 [Rhizophagus irregularis DAOM 181602=DAOM 197198]|eukprot:XP_025187670.1 hypothetical protein GLOIN_2v1471288 [Rhizophagus irregularis DAOM 181602=DAOM 197198]